MKDARELYEAIENIEEEMRSSITTRIAMTSGIEDIKNLSELMEDSERKYHVAINHSIQTIANMTEARMDDLETAFYKVQKLAGFAMQEPEAEKGHRPTESELRDLYREPEEREATPNGFAKQDELLKLLLPAIQATRAGEDVIDMNMTVNAEPMEGWFELRVKITFATGSVKLVDVTADSEIAMIVDICKALM